MGCITSRPTNNHVVSPITRVAPVRPYLSNENSGSFKVKISEAIKRKDPILFEKTLQRCQVRLNELVIGMRTILHDIAENNFAAGMCLILDYMFQRDPVKAAQILNAPDLDGNSPVMTCCISNSPDTLEAILRYEAADLNAKNDQGKTPLELAMENSDSCANLLSAVTNTSLNKNITKRNPGSVDLFISSNRKPSILMGKSKKESRLSMIETRDLNTTLTSVFSMTKECPSKVGLHIKLHTLINELKERDMNFVDDEFPHNMYSVLGKDHANIKPFRWLRPAEFMNTDIKNIKLFEGIDFAEAPQSTLAGCDLYSILAAMVEFPQRLLNAFTTKEANKYGAYSVKFLVSGIPIEILLDDYFPCHENGSLAFLNPVGSEIWLLLIEKAFAKLYGTYSEIKNVTAAEALEIMTGMPSSQHLLKDFNDEDLWELLLDFDKKNYIVCVGVDNEENNKNKILTVVNLYETKHYKVVKLRNHFQDFAWSGMFSEKSKNWTKELRDEINYSRNEKNCVYVELQEFQKQFDFLYVCHYHEDWVRNQIETSSDPNSATFFEMTITEETDVIIAVHQKHPRHVNDYPGYNISPVEIMVVEKTGEDNLTKIASGENGSFVGKQTTYSDEKIEMKLPEGKYVIRVKVRWVDQETHDFILSTFSSKNLVLNQASNDEYPNFLERVYKDAGSRIKEKYQFNNSCEFISGWSGPHLWVYGINKGKKTWNLEVIFQKMVNLRLPNKYMKTDNILQITIPPGEQNVMYAKRENFNKVEVLWTLRHSWE